MLSEHPLVTEKQLYNAANARLSDVADACHKRYAIPVQFHVEVGRPHEHIADYARLHAINLTVLGSHADNFARDLFIGSTALRFLHEGTHPALITKTLPRTPYRTVLVAVDFSDISRTAIDSAARIAPRAVIHALHVYDVLFEGKMRYAGVDDGVIQQYRDAADTEASRMMHEFLLGPAQHGAILPIVRHGYPSRVILEEAHTLHADLIVMGKHSRPGLNELFLGSVTEALLHGLNRDLLVVTEVTEGALNNQPQHLKEVKVSVWRNQESITSS
jgi:nucleotide-binding universal stress UspA family protein